MTTRNTGRCCSRCGKEIIQREVARGNDIEGYVTVWVDHKHSCMTHMKKRVDQLEQKLEDLSDYVSRCARGDGD